MKYETFIARNTQCGKPLRGKGRGCSQGSSYNSYVVDDAGNVASAGGADVQVDR